MKEKGRKEQKTHAVIQNIDSCFQISTFNIKDLKALNIHPLCMKVVVEE
jgi:hypothetical protein